MIPNIRPRPGEWRRARYVVLGIIITGAAFGALLEYASDLTVVCVATGWAFIATVVALVATIKPAHENL